jgi:glycosyltransferase involved in cell wall biosynthesis
VDPRHTRIVPNPVDLDAFRPKKRSHSPGRPLKVVFISRISVRKGVESIVDLSHRLADLEGSIVLEVIGDRTQWSDYRQLLTDLDPRIASYRGSVSPEQIPGLLNQADLLIQPSKYEPFGLTVSEALASGLPVVATDEVGAAEDVSPECMAIVPVGDMDALETAVRSFITRLQAGEGPDIALRARAEAERLFDPLLVAKAVAEALEDLSA